MSQRQSISELIDNEYTQADKKQEFENLVRIREFASRELLLPDNKSYTSYVELDREYVTWVVFAAEQLSLQPKLWCFWVVGCVPYRGYFSHDKALAFSSQLKQQGLEVHIAPVPAYSTLGWFIDPVLSSMLGRGEIVTAEYIFHELAHQQVYIKNDSSFNEAFATAVGQVGVTRWLTHENQSESLENYLQSKRNKQEIYKLIDELRRELLTIYQSSMDHDDKQKQKAQAFSRYQQEMSDKLRAWNKYQQYKSWLLDDMNNAKLNAYATYQALVPKFIDLYQRCGQRLDQFYDAVDRMRPLEKQQRVDRLNNQQC